MTRADIYETILYYTTRASTDARQIRNSKEPKRRVFFTDRVDIAMDIIEGQIQQLKAIDRKEKQENEQNT